MHEISSSRIKEVQLSWPNAKPHPTGLGCLMRKCLLYMCMHGDVCKGRCHQKSLSDMSVEAVVRFYPRTRALFGLIMQTVGKDRIIITIWR